MDDDMLASILVEHRCLEVLFAGDGDIYVHITNERGEHANIILRNPVHTDASEANPLVRGALVALFHAIKEQNKINAGCEETEPEYAVLKANFFAAFANVPLPLRTEIIAVVGDDSFTWYTAKLEIINDTKHASKILELLKKIGVL
jgi:hypothetical protein